MRKKNVYVFALIFVLLFVWMGYFLYTEASPKLYKNGTLVELPGEMTDHVRALSA